MLLVVLICLIVMTPGSCQTQKKHQDENSLNTESDDTTRREFGVLSYPFQRNNLQIRSLHSLQKSLSGGIFNSLFLQLGIVSGSSFGTFQSQKAATLGNEQFSMKQLLRNFDSQYNLSQTCQNDTIRFVEDLRKPEGTYAIQMLDADGKIPSGFLNGNFLWLGDFEECQSVTSLPDSTTGRQFHGRHCVLSMMMTGNPLPLTLGTCIPDSCNTSLVRAVGSFLVNKVDQLTKLGLVVTNAVCYEDNPYSPGDIVALVICGIVVLIVTVGTLVDVLSSYLDEKTSTEISRFDGLMDATEDVNESTGLLSGNTYHDVRFSSNKQREKRYVKFLLAFSIINNGKKLFNTSTATGPLTSINGLRVLSMWWVIQGHTYAFISSFVDNPLEAYKIVQRFSFQPILNGTFSVDTFFFMTGLLVTYLTLKQLSEASGKLNWAMFIFHRYWRLTPAYAFVLMFYTTLMLHIGNSPGMYSIYAGDNNPLYATIKECQSSWWANLLYINNYYPYYGNLGTQCMGWSWYLANDMQFYLISSILIWLLYRSKWVGIGVTSSLIFGCILIRLLLVVIYDIPTLGGAARKHTEDVYAKNDLLYNKGYTRIAPFLVGVLLGFLLQRTHCHVRLHKVLVLTGWCVAIATGLAVVYGMYQYNHDGTLMKEGAAIVYISTARFLWGLVLAWVIFACATGYGGMVNQILSWKIWAPLGRLTYTAYLVHPIIMFLFNLNQLTPIHFTDINMIYFFFGHLVASYSIAFLVSMAVEAPMMSLEKIVFKRT